MRASAVGSQLVSTRASSASFGFGSATREHAARVFISRSHASASGLGSDGPGPASAHAVTGSIGRRESVHAARSSQFGIDRRFKYAQEAKRLGANPGPGAYNTNLHGALGRQTSFVSPSGAAYGFGTADRQHAAKVFISSEHAKTVKLDVCPGPASVNLPSSFGKNASTKGTTSNSWSFGKADRFGYSDYRAAVNGALPGPGAYSV